MAARIIKACGGDVSGMRIGVLGVSFKPGTDDVRESPSLVIIPLLQEEGAKVSQAHLSYMNPFPQNLGAVLGKFQTILLPEMNSGHLMMLLRNAFPKLNFVGYNRVRGIPFQVSELKEKIRGML